MADHVLDLGRPQIRVDRHERDAEPVEREPVPEEGRSVLDENADALAGPEAGGFVGGRQRLHMFQRFRVRDFARRYAVGRGRLRQDAEERALRIARGGGGEEIEDGALFHPFT